MKNKVRTLLLAASLSAAVFSMGVYAESTAEDTAEAVTEAGTEADWYLTDSELEQKLTGILTELSGMSDEELATQVKRGSTNEKAEAAKWSNVKDELGKFESLSDAEVTFDEESETYTLKAVAQYADAAEGTDVTITFVDDTITGAESVEWNVNYPMSKKFEEAGLNTLMGLGIVFLSLIFLSFVIGRFKLLSGVGSKKKEEAAPKAAPAPAVVEEEEELADDEELVAVIAAAIAASENTSTDGFVVRSIKKANRKKWQNA